MAKNRTDDDTKTIETDSHHGSRNGNGAAADEGQPFQERALDALRTAPDALRETATLVADRAPDAVRQTANVVAEHAPDALAASQTAISEATRRIQDSSTEQLTGWASFAVGLWLGLIVGRAPRPLSLLAGLPALVLSGALVARRGGTRVRPKVSVRSK